MIGRQEVPAEHLVGQGQVFLEDGGHLCAEVVLSTELLQNLHGQHEDLLQVLFLRSEVGRSGMARAWLSREANIAYHSMTR